ncbi:hypothetical protein [Paenibacillus sp. XY044]|uniref:hypothetical protein n=1 Tax=Paenibacillus sp. XY044 TaxID=2026089 RepID=UPI000B98D55F|nr:hypothetical protein [Paenibacillus sp. XY044]OZB98046.1 hypothetical protein CJP46_02450 [Paenibacillus sp. XY044]
MNFNQLSQMEQMDYLSELLANEIFNLGELPYHKLLLGQQLTVKKGFHESLKAENIQITDVLIKVVEEEFAGSPMASFLREYGYSITQSSEFTEVVEQLTPERKVTLIKFSEFGFPVFINTVINSVEVKPYAQYNESLRIIHKPKKKRSLWQNIILPKDELLVYDGWLNVDLDIITKETIKENESVKVTQSKYSSFDRTFIADIVSALGQPIAKVN